MVIVTTSEKSKVNSKDNSFKFKNLIKIVDKMVSFFQIA